MTALPTGTVTFLFTDIEGSTRLLEAEPEAYRAALARHDTLLEQAIVEHGGTIFQRAGDSFSAAFSSPNQAVRAALDGQRALQREPWGEGSPIRARMGLHTGEAEIQSGQYFGLALHRCARLMNSAHGSQVLLTTATASLVQQSLPEGVTLDDLGEHRLRDLSHAERIFQLAAPDLPRSHPPLRTLRTVPNNLPLQVTPFVGREQQIQSVREVLVHADTRLLTLTGPGGTGKTRLALQAAAELVDSFSGGVFFVPLASVADPDLVPSAIAQALDVRETPGRSLLESLRTFLQPKQLLLILDNFEQVIDAASMVADLVRAASGLKVVVTSRAVLRLYGEREYPVPPLALPDRRASPSAAHLSQFEAVRLFVERARASRPDFAVTDQNAADVAEICHRLDGLPLAIELAAARVRALAPRSLLQRMERRLPLLTGGARDLPARQRTLSDAIAWSYDLLEPGERILFQRLAVFRGCTLESAERVCAGEPPRPGATSIALAPLEIDVLDGLVSLVEKSLLRHDEAGGEAWYVMLETVREFALERLEESGEAGAARRRLILAAVDLAETAESMILGPEQTTWFARVELEHDNLRAALRWSEESGYAGPALRLACALWWFWSAHGHLREGMERLSSLVTRFRTSPAGARDGLYARALYAGGMLAANLGDHGKAQAMHEESLALRRAAGDREGIFNSLEGLGTVACLRGDLAAARQYLEECLMITRDLDDDQGYATTLHTLANIVSQQGDLALARSYGEQALRLYRPASDRRTVASTTLSLAVIVQEQGDYEAAQVLATEALGIYRSVGDARSEALGLANLGSIATSAGDHATAWSHLRDSIDTFQSIGDPGGVAFVLERFAGLAIAQSRHDGALRLASAAATLRQQVGAPLTPTGQQQVEHGLAPARRILGPDAAGVAWHEAQSLSLEEAIALALRVTEPASAEAERGLPFSNLDADVSVAVLTRRQREIAVLIAQGFTNKQIADALIIEEGTAANHVNHILTKLCFSNRAQIAAWAAEHGLLS